MTMLRTYRTHLGGLVALAAAVLLAYAAAANDFHLTILTFCAIHGVAAIALCLCIGFGGLISLGTSAFYGVGAYTAALAVQAGTPSLLALLCAPLVSGLLGYAMARPLLRLNSHYLAMATLAFAVIMYIVFGQARTITGGLDPGIMGLPAFALGGWRFAGPRAMYWVCWVAVLGSAFVALNLVNSPAGRALRALRSSDLAASCLGIETARLCVQVFGLSAAMIGLAGGLYAFFMRSFNATAFEPGLSIEMLMMVLIGSVSTVWGALAGAVVITILPNLLENFEQSKMLVYGVIMTLIMIFLPQGLVQGIFDTVSRRFAAGEGR